MAERFSIGGMSSILILFMTQYLCNSQGNHEFTGPQAMIWYHNFFAAVAFFTAIGAIIADALLGKYKTIIIFSIIYCFGYLTLALFTNKTGLACGLILISIGLGCVLPCFASHLGDQFGRKNRQQISKAYSWFCLSVSIGAFISMLLIPYLLEKYGPKIAFAATGISMLIAVIIFYKGRKVFATVLPIGWKQYREEFKDKDNLKAISNLAIIFIFTIFIHALHDQSFSLLVMQAGEMNRQINLGFLKFTFLQSQIQPFEYIFLAIFIPLFSYVIYPFLEKFTTVTYLKKIAAGFFVAAASFAILAHAQTLIEQRKEVGVIWQIIAYILLSIEEVLVAVTCIEISYTHSPRSIKSTGLALYFLSISLGNVLISAVNGYLQNADGNLTISTSTYLWYFCYAIIVVGLLFIIYAPYYKGRVFLQIGAIREILDVILEVGRKKIALIALSGSFASRNLSEDLDVIRDMKYEYSDDYNFLIITDDKHGIGLQDITFLSNEITTGLVSQGLTSITLPGNNNVRFNFKSIYSFKLDLQQDPQFANFKKESLYLYKGGNFKVIELLENTAENIKSIAVLSYKSFYYNGSSFLNITKILKDAEPNLTLVVFQLHQAAEHLYRCCLVALTGDSPKFHRLKSLNALLCDRSKLFIDIFPSDSEEEKKCFELLEDGYLARYDTDYMITYQQLDYLISRVEKLKKVTEKFFKEEMKILDLNLTN